MNSTGGGRPTKTTATATTTDSGRSVFIGPTGPQPRPGKVSARDSDARSPGPAKRWPTLPEQSGPASWPWPWRPGARARFGHTVNVNGTPESPEEIGGSVDVDSRLVVS